ncbi:auxin-repressed protein [Musa troglodytarum]|uniref:Auxin-repressed protein n=1 Tax=Musa troglodytarum TaxID=320322 RepID=A0A9E7H349_9LILI|nr:auxin-repressed protein [Musa troglodytarum]
MGLLDQLWDDTVAGPRPETGLGRLRKHSSFGFRPNSGGKAEGAAADGGIARSEGGGGDVEVRVTRSIMIKRPAGCPSPGNATPPASPAGSTPPISPFSGEGLVFSKSVRYRMFEDILVVSEFFHSALLMFCHAKHIAILGLTGYFSGANQEAGSGTGLGGNHHPMHMKEWWEEEGKEEEEWWVLDRRILLLLMRFELC